MLHLRNFTSRLDWETPKLLARGLCSALSSNHSVLTEATEPRDKRRWVEQKCLIDNRGQALSNSSLQNSGRGLHRIYPRIRVVGKTDQSRNEIPSRRIYSTAASTSGDKAVVRPSRFAILETGHASPFTQEAYGGYSKMFIDFLKDPDEEWHVYSIIDGHFPSNKELSQFDGFVVTGSRHDAHGPEEWISKLCDILQRIHSNQQKVLGVCFGHQVLSRALGGETGPASTGWEFRLKDYNVSPGLATKPYARELPPRIKIFGVHRDQVSKVPPHGEVLASSGSTPVEMFCVGDTALGIQGHPEFSKDIVEDLLQSRLDLGVITEEVARRARKSWATSDPDKEALQRLCKAFLKR